MSNRNERFREIIDDVRANSFVPGYQAEDAECAGLALSHFFHWDGYRILEAAASALEDANFHGECAQVLEMLQKLKDA